MGPALHELLHRRQIIVLHQQQRFFENASRVIADTRLQQCPQIALLLACRNDQRQRRSRVGILNRPASEHAAGDQLRAGVQLLQLLLGDAELLRLLLGCQLGSGMGQHLIHVMHTSSSVDGTAAQC